MPQLRGNEPILELNSCMLVSSHLPPKVAKKIKLQGIRWSLQAIDGFLTILPFLYHPQTE
jgi:hypothetical protein